MDNIHEFTRQILRFTDGEELSALLAALALGLATVAGIVLNRFRARGVRRIHAAAAAYAEREIVQHRRFHKPDSERLVSQPDPADCMVSCIDPAFRTDFIESNSSVAFVRLESPAPVHQGTFSMLVLSCKLGERIVLPGIDTTVAVVAIIGKVARLGISAPVEVTVQRAEVGKHIDHQLHSIRAVVDRENFRSHE